MTNPKIQFPSKSQIPNLKFQPFKTWDIDLLKFIWELVLGFWNLKKMEAPFLKPAFCFSAFFLFLCLPVLSALEVPKRVNDYVTDRAGVLSSSAKAELEAVLRAFEEKTSNQVVVAT
jgi:hypothetical protein